jgi:trehalose 6-phosphate synthase
LETLVAAINDEFSTRDWTPVTYMYRHLTRVELLACYCAADVAMVTPVKDGMNLVAKEYCSARNDNGGVLILSEFAGSASELGDGALLVNPYDVEGMAAALQQAFAIPASERAMRMVRMRSRIRVCNVYDWYANFRAALGFATHHPLIGPGKSPVARMTTAAG